MTLTLLVGGARSGKSRAAERLAVASGLPVTYLATGEPGDAEMAGRIARHRAERPPSWTTVEAPREVARVLAGLEGSQFLILDCLTLWLSNLLELDDQSIFDAAEHIASDLATRFLASAVVTNEVGSGIVPGDPITRRYRDLLGQVNGIFRRTADRALLCVAGGVVPILELGDDHR
ncbi:MAG: bifunctional adenosylcobinamide kinase/adenosylcobinamide-phosphate guanylyltransferase [Acidimicrobiia bacterium]